MRYVATPREECEAHVVMKVREFAAVSGNLVHVDVVHLVRGERDVAQARFFGRFP